MLSIDKSILSWNIVELDGHSQASDTDIDRWCQAYLAILTKDTGTFETTLLFWAPRASSRDMIIDDTI